MRLLVFGLLLAAVPAIAQEPRLVLREAYIPDPFGGGTFMPDTSAMERATLEGEPIYLGAILLDWSDAALASVSVEPDPFTGAPQLSFVLTDVEAFRLITEAQVGKPIAIVYNGQVLTAPTVNGAIPNGQVQITGQFSRDEVDELATRLRDASGAYDGRAVAVQALRAAADWSAPEEAMMTFLRAARLQEWRTLVQGVHPATLQSIREEAQESLILTGDTLSLRASAVVAPPVPPRPEGDDPTGESTDPEAHKWSVARLLEMPAPGTDWTDFSDEQVAILYLSVFSTSFPTPVELDVEGTLLQEDDQAFIVLTEQDTPWMSPGDSSARVFELQRLGQRWHVLLPSGGW